MRLLANVMCLCCALASAVLWLHPTQIDTQTEIRTNMDQDRDTHRHTDCTQTDTSMFLLDLILEDLPIFHAGQLGVKTGRI